VTHVGKAAPGVEVEIRENGKVEAGHDDGEALLRLHGFEAGARGERSRILMPAPWKSAQLDLELLRASCHDQEIFAVNLPSSSSTL
jgi:hypothetical protein